MNSFHPTRIGFVALLVFVLASVLGFATPVTANETLTRIALYMGYFGACLAVGYFYEVRRQDRTMLRNTLASARNLEKSGHELAGIAATYAEVLTVALKALQRHHNARQDFSVLLAEAGQTKQEINDLAKEIGGQQQSTSAQELGRLRIASNECWALLKEAIEP